MNLATTKRRLLQYLEKNGISRTDFYTSTGLKRGLLDTDKIDASVKDTDIAKIIAAYPDIDLVWLITGETRILKTSQSKTQIQEQPNGISFENSTQVREPLISMYRQEPTIEAQAIPLYSFEAMASVISTLDDATRWVEDKIYLPNMPAVDGGAYVRGNSMEPIISNGDIVVFKKSSIDNIIYGQMYLISVCLDGDVLIMVKYVYPSDVSTDHIQLVSHNSDQHPPKHIHKSSIQAIALVKASIRYHL